MMCEEDTCSALPFWPPVPGLNVMLPRHCVRDIRIWAQLVTVMAYSCGLSMTISTLQSSMRPRPCTPSTRNRSTSKPANVNPVEASSRTVPVT